MLFRRAVRVRRRELSRARGRSFPHAHGVVWRSPREQERRSTYPKQASPAKSASSAMTEPTAIPAVIPRSFAPVPPSLRSSLQERRTFSAERTRGKQRKSGRCRPAHISPQELPVRWRRLETFAQQARRLPQHRLLGMQLSAAKAASPGISPLTRIKTIDAFSLFDSNP